MNHIRRKNGNHDIQQNKTRQQKKTNIVYIKIEYRIFIFVGYGGHTQQKKTVLCQGNGMQKQAVQRAADWGASTTKKCV